MAREHEVPEFSICGDMVTGAKVPNVCTSRDWIHWAFRLSNFVVLLVCSDSDGDTVRPARLRTLEILDEAPTVSEARDGTTEGASTRGVHVSAAAARRSLAGLEKGSFLKLAVVRQMDIFHNGKRIGNDIKAAYLCDPNGGGVHLRLDPKMATAAGVDREGRVPLGALPAIAI